MRLQLKQAHRLPDHDLSRVTTVLVTRRETLHETPGTDAILASLEMDVARAIAVILEMLGMAETRVMSVILEMPEARGRFEMQEMCGEGEKK
jgi:hypothetical protein